MNLKLLTLVTAVLVLGGCASYGATEQPATHVIDIEKVDSTFVRIGVVTIRPEADGISVRGEVSRRVAGRGPIHGHLHLEAADAKRRVLSRVDVAYRRASVAARTAKFIAHVEVNPDDVAVLRIIHHEDHAG